MPIGIQDFEKLRRGGYVYVDKTEFVYKLARLGTPFFLSRPRRFGKSLLLSTFESLFLGKKELFEGLAIANKEWDWAEYPVLKISFGGDSYPDLESLKSAINLMLSRYEELYGLEVSDLRSAPRLTNIITRVFEKTGKPVVILIDDTTSRFWMPSTRTTRNRTGRSSVLSTARSRNVTSTSAFCSSRESRR